MCDEEKKGTASTYTKREKELIQEGYDPSQAAEIVLDEEGAERFYRELSEDD